MLDYKRILRGLLRRLVWVVKGCPKTPPLLEMVWPSSLSDKPPIVVVPSGYRMRQFEAVDEEAYYDLLASASMERCSLAYWNRHILPEGFFLIESEKTGELVAACFASHHPTVRHPQAGNFGWLAANPRHSGKGLGLAVSAAVTDRLVRGGYKRIYLETHDFRLPAIKIYLSMGWVPLLYCEEMPARWERICQKIDWPFTPEKWVSK